MNPHKLLIVDDEEAILEALQRTLRADYELLLADSADAALRLLKKHRNVSLILCDQRMPAMTGVRLLEKSRGIAPHAVRMLLTGYSDIEAVIEAVNRGEIYRYLTKPWENDALRSEIKRGIEYFELQKTIRDQHEKLKELDKAKNLFLMLISHELKTPLTTILAFTESYQKGLAQTRDEQQLFIKRIEEGAKSLGNLIEETLDLITAQTGKLIPHKEQMKLDEMIHSVIENLHPKTIEKKIVFETMIPPLKIKADPELIRKNFKKILEYAVKAAREEDKIWITAKENKKESIEVQISFHGEVLNREQKKKIFEPFLIVGDILNHKMGAGLGLPVSKAIIEAHGGEIDVESSKKKGTLLTIVLPF
ncbi:MAG: hybrid sensor histidine kinase/response regulator [Deltaproteobacteria bacterium]